jgi:hypothetical protein
MSAEADYGPCRRREATETKDLPDAGGNDGKNRFVWKRVA